MKAPLQRLGVRAVAAALIASGIGCYPAYPGGSAYGPGYGYGSAYAQGQDAKGYEVPYAESAPAPQAPPPPRYGVDPGVVIAGAAAIGLLGYAIGSSNHGYCGPGPYFHGRAYYGPRCYPY